MTDGVVHLLLLLLLLLLLVSVPVIFVTHFLCTSSLTFVMFLCQHQKLLSH